MAADPNVKFLVFLKSLGEHPAGYRVAHIHVSQLPAVKRTRDNLSQAISVLIDLKTRHKSGDIFLLRNSDILFVVKGLSRKTLEAACRAIGSILGSGTGEDFVNIHGGRNESFTIFDLERDIEALMLWAEQAAGLASAPGSLGDEPKGVIDLAQLGQVKEEIQRVDISTMLFNQPVYDIGGREPEVLFHEMYVSVRVLEEMYCPHVSLTSNRWLFADLTEELDTAVLRFLADPDGKTGIKRMSININLSSLASPKFVRFDADIPASRRHGVILEINKTDIFENMRLYRELVPFLRQRGYRLLLDGLSFLNVGAIDFSGIECDFAKVFWSNEADALDETRLERVSRKFRAPDGPRFLLAHCDSAASVRFARTHGIELAQGRLVDQLVRRRVPI